MFKYLIVSLLALSSMQAAVWQKTSLGRTLSLVGEDGFPEIDSYGNLMNLLPAWYEPSGYVASETLHVLRLDVSRYADPPVLDNNGFAVVGEYFRLNDASYASDVWSTGSSFPDWTENLVAPSYASRMDSDVSICYWLPDALEIETLSTPSHSRLTLPVVAEFGSVAVDADSGIHVLWVNASDELWHGYYYEENWETQKVSDGPVVAMAAVSGSDQLCHLAFSTADQLLACTIDGVLSAVPEVVIADTISTIEYLDVVYTSSDGQGIAFADPVQNSVRLAEKDATLWTLTTVTSLVGPYTNVAMSAKADGSRVVAAVRGAGKYLHYAEEAVGVWSHETVASNSQPNYFQGVDLVCSSSLGPVILANENTLAHLSAYTTSSIAELFPALIKPIEIRKAAVITWPTPSEGAYSQVLQSIEDLSDPEGWVREATRYIHSWDSSETYETTVETDSASKFYRVVEN